MRLRAALALFAFTLRRLVAGKRIVAALLIACAAPACEALICEIPNRLEATSFYDIAWEMGAHIEPLLLALVYALSLTTSEIEDGTAPYVLLAALPRAAVAAVQIAAAAAGVTLLLGVSVEATIVVDRVLLPIREALLLPPDEQVALCALVAGAAALAYIAVFTFLGYALRRAVAVSIAVAIIWEAIVAQMPLRASWYTVTNNVRALLDQAIVENYGGAIGYPTPTLEERPGVVGAVVFLAVVTAAGVGLAMVAASRRSLARGESG